MCKTFAVLSKCDTKDLKSKIWFNSSNNESLRLTLEGFKFLSHQLSFKYYECQLEIPLTNKNLIQLERFFNGIYYIVNPKKIILFDESEASMLILSNNNLKKYLDNLENEYLD